MRSTVTFGSRSAVLGVLALVVLLAPVGCSYNNHRTLGTTEKLAHSEIPEPAKVLGTLVLAAPDSIASPFLMIVDQVENDPQYDEDHHYLSYAGTRVIHRSEMGPYKYPAYLWSIPVETILLPATLLVDGLWTLIVE